MNIYNNGDSDQSRFSFDSFMFLGFEEHEQTLTCSMKICDTEGEACTPSCGARKRYDLFCIERYFDYSIKAIVKFR